ncbi:MAG: TatD family hydrolase [Candidatus Amesbacteria bacterium]|nr:TatD family hydrolase [Candidatus Amesbacteria bacterium]
MVDAHCHLQDLETFDISELKYVICAGASVDSSKKAIEIASSHQNVFATVGIHPESNDDFNKLRNLVKFPKVVAIGECGLDSDNPRECELLQKHLDLAKEFDLPIVIHNRNQDKNILKILGNYPKVMLHCFTSNEEFMKECVNRGWYISFGGILTFKKSHALREVAKQIPDNLLLIETDSPYLSPEPFRGKINQPKNVKIVAQMLANIRNTSIDQIEETTDKNCKRLFNI